MCVCVCVCRHLTANCTYSVCVFRPSKLFLPLSSSSSKPTAGRLHQEGVDVKSHHCHLYLWRGDIWTCVPIKQFSPKTYSNKIISCYLLWFIFQHFTIFLPRLTYPTFLLYFTSLGSCSWSASSRGLNKNKASKMLNVRLLVCTFHKALIPHTAETIRTSVALRTSSGQMTYLQWAGQK